MYPWRTTGQLEDGVFGSTRKASIALIVALVTLHIALKAVFFSPWFLYRVALPLETATGGLVTPATLAGSIQLIVLVVIGTIAFGGFSWRQIGFRTGGQATSGILIVLIWATACLVSLLFGGSLALDGPTLRTAAASILQATAGSALTEELFYRGFLLVQVYLVIRGTTRSWSTGRCLFWAVALVQVYFAANHVPAGMRAGLPADVMLLWLVQTACVGAMFAVLFVQTGSLVLSVGAHALLNFSMPFLASPLDPALVVLLLVCAAMLAGPWLFERGLQGATAVTEPAA